MEHTFYLGNVIDVLRSLPDESVHCVVTSPPYWGLRDYGVPGQIGLESTPDEYVEKMVEVFREVRRVLRGDGVLFLNLGDSYYGNPGNGRSSGSTLLGDKPHLSGASRVQPYGNSGTAAATCQSPLKHKDLVGIPWMVAFALRSDGWYLRSDIIWAKPNSMPESVTDRPTKSHEYVFLLSKSERYFYDHVAIQEESVTQDLRRPYGSEGAWQMDGRPKEKRHGGELRGKGGRNAFRGQGANRDGANGPANRDGRDMKDIGVGVTRNKRDVWTIATQPYPKAHFATFPEALVEPCILAGTSEAGCCPKCGSPWTRVTSKRKVGPVWNQQDPRTGQHPAGDLAEGRGKFATRYEVATDTVGWQPGCSCGLEPVPATVLDPFGGSGTVSVVAQRLNRSSIYIDLNPAYRQMAIDRMRPEQPSLVQPYEILTREVAG